MSPVKICKLLDLFLKIIYFIVINLIVLNFNEPFINTNPLSIAYQLFRDLDFLECDAPLDLKGNKTAYDELKYGCLKFGGQNYDEVNRTRVNCTVLPGIQCVGNKTFMKDGFPCIKYVIVL